MMLYKIAFYAGIAGCLLMVASCFMPWIHINSLDWTFNGLNVRPFPNGNNYGKGGRFLLLFSGMILIGMLIPQIWAKRLNLFLAAFLLAFSLRTYVIFTGSLFKNEVIVFPGMYLVLLASFLIMFSAVFSKAAGRKKNEIQKEGL